MADEVKPFPALRPVVPYSGPLRFHAECEMPLMDSLAHEHSLVSSTEMDYFSLDVPSSTNDPLYDEPVQAVFQGPFKFRGYVEWPDDTALGTEQGTQTEWDSSVWVARLEWEERHIPPPGEGDIIRLWNVPFYAQGSTGRQGDPGAGFYFDVLQVDDDGHLFDSPNFVGFKLTLKRRTEFAPERRIDALK